MNFSELFKHTGQLCKFSPNGKYLNGTKDYIYKLRAEEVSSNPANIVEYRLIIRDVQTLQVMNLYTCLDTVQTIEWSSDSMFILCGMFKRGIVQVWSLEQMDWTCKIDEGSAGLCQVRWSPDGRHILTTADFQLRITVWSLLNKLVSYIKYPKSCQKGIDFSNGGKYAALAERRDCKDYVSIFACSNWELVKHFETETEDLSGVEWSPNGRVLGIWESLLHYKVLVYSVDGRCLATYSAYEHALGVKSLAWAPTSQFLALGSYDQKVRILNHITWKTVTVQDHPPTLENSNVIVYKEMESRPTVLKGETAPPPSTLFATQSKYEIQPFPVQVPVVKPDMNKANPKMGVGTVAFSQNCHYMFSKNDNMPHTLWVWDIQRLTLAVVLIQVSPITCVVWDPSQPRLALCTGANKLYMWSPAGCLSVEVPAEASFQVQSLRWHPDGNALLLIGKDNMCACFLGSSSVDTPSTDS